MAIWWFGLVYELIFPAAMILFGRGFMTHPVEEKGRKSFYRQVGSRWKTIGWIMAIVTVLAQILLLGRSHLVMGIGGGVIVALQILSVLLVVLPARRAMKECSAA